jgi:hypothetical protein
MLTPQFARDGYLGPLPVFTETQCRRIADSLRRKRTPPFYRAWGSALVRGGKNLARPVWHRVKPYLPKRG